MKLIRRIYLTALFVFLLISCSHTKEEPEMDIIFLHHSVGEFIWNGKPWSIPVRAAKKISKKLARIISPKPELQKLFEQYNKIEGRNYNINELAFPKASPYGWNNNPFDYYNIWVKNAGQSYFMEEPTLEILTAKYQVIIFKHCYPVSNIHAEQDIPSVDSDYHSLSNYKLQYFALREKLHSFPNTKFILFTGATQVKANTSEEEAIRAQEFFKWVVEEWDIPGDNIYLWDLYSLQTDGSLYFKDEYAKSAYDSHPNKAFASRVVKLLFNRIIDIIENNGELTSLTGVKKNS